MNYTASILDFFKSPKWMTNLLLGGVCVLIPLVGPLILFGWLITGFWGRQDENFAAFPAFDFSHFGKYLERGLWPFVVSFVVGMGISIVFLPLGWLLMLPMMFAAGPSSGEEANAASCLSVSALGILMMLFWAVMIVAMMVVLVPLMLRATITQDFAASFDLRFMKRFLALTWKEIVSSSLFVTVAGAVLTFAGMLVFCIGMYFAAVLVYFSWVHLQKQLYTLYLSRGGEPVPFSSKLFDSPPPLPAV